jgi:hypothetical protein
LAFNFCAERGLRGGGRIVASGLLLRLRSPSQGSGDGDLPMGTAGEDSLVLRPSMSGVAREDPVEIIRGTSGSGDIDQRMRRPRVSDGGAMRYGVGDIRVSSTPGDVAVHSRVEVLPRSVEVCEESRVVSSKEAGGVGSCASCAALRDSGLYEVVYCMLRECCKGEFKDSIEVRGDLIVERGRRLEGTVANVCDCCLCLLRCCSLGLEAVILHVSWC